METKNRRGIQLFLIGILVGLLWAPATAVAEQSIFDPVVKISKSLAEISETLKKIEQKMR